MADAFYLFEDEGWKRLLPLTHLRPASELRCGCFTLRERIERALGIGHLKILARAYLAPVTDLAHAKNLVEGNIYLNARLLAFSRDELLNLGKGEMLLAEDEVAAFRPASPSEIRIPFTAAFLRTQKASYKTKESTAKLVRHPWDLIAESPALLAHDFSLLRPQVLGFIDPAVKVYGDKRALFVGQNSRIEAFSILHLEGPVYIGENVRVGGFSTIAGPCYIGDGTVVDGGKLSESSFGPQCRLGGEIECSIFQGYSNKRHEGFLGHSVIGEWVNLGAGTTNSDLKNNYSEIKVQLGRNTISSGMLKLGCFMGDHTKTGIGTLINTGSYFGVFCNVLGGKLSPKYIPSFSWDTGEVLAEYEVSKAVETARVVMARRGVDVTPELERLFREVFVRTKGERVP
ncbi:hypothetical protein AMJ40_00675 [candidate division TA06 bacterium DG_26]|uniref:Glucose-1-phosphate thymidylyltransferase n=1 Tax=candidate division TA06 bacterium DG_26 TaxID=1703771 RepID=A0A0S7WLY9_UNCT6|nr:MAG: hypothetical protein AMJ40_00675 [candidate division TA06 bacterium DG_26]